MDLLIGLPWSSVEVGIRFEVEAKLVKISFWFSMIETLVILSKVYKLRRTFNCYISKLLLTLLSDLRKCKIRLGGLNKNNPPG